MPQKKIVRTGEDLKHIRIEKYGASIRELARAACVAPSTVIRWETKSQLPICPTGALRNILHVMRVRTLDYKSMGPFKGPFEGPAPSQTVSVTCEAKTRSGAPCKKPSVPGKLRCRLHGGLSTGPKTEEGRAKCAEAARARWRK